MADSGSSWNTVPLSDMSAVKFVGNWRQSTTSNGFRNVSRSETNASVAFSFHGTQARAIGFVSFGSGDDPLQAQLTWSSGGKTLSIPSSSGDTHCNGGSPSSPYDLGGAEMCPPPFYTTDPMLLCDRYTLNLTVMPDQAMKLKQFEFLPCTSDSDPTSVSSSTTALASASSPASAIAGEKKQTLSAGVIAGAALGALAALLALGGLAFLIILRRRSRRRRRHMGTLPSPSSPPPSPSPLLICFSRSRSWLRLPGRSPKPTNPSAEFLNSSSSAPAVASRRDGRMVQGYYPTTTMMIDTSASTPASAALGTTSSTGQRSSARSAGNIRDGGTAFENQPLRPDNVEPEPSGLAVARGYLPDSKELMAWQEREQAGAQGIARTPSTAEVLPLYQARRSLRRPS
ncbi:hypothetical protein H4582DRAFT_193778 [Lactarius indigo]|nr:hypothetical protein H4582DRAFT_193778 [Lactarius indigo]